MDNTGTVYLIHFSRPYHHARHYIGFCYKNKPQQRLTEHKIGAGARLLRAVNAAGIDYDIVRIWQGVTRRFERRLKNQKKSSCLCPECKKLKS